MPPYIISEGELRKVCGVMKEFLKYDFCQSRMDNWIQQKV